MLKLSQKRSRDWANAEYEADSMTCSPYKSFNLLDTTPTKRLRPQFHLDGKQNLSSANIQRPSSPVSPQRESVFMQADRQEDEVLGGGGGVGGGGEDPMEDLHRYCDKIKPKTTHKKKEEDKLFTLDQVKEIVSRALAEKEQALREEYDRILQEQLQEQFRNFTKFNQDYVSRQLKENDFSYLS